MLDHTADFPRPIEGLPSEIDSSHSRQALPSFPEVIGFSPIGHLPYRDAHAIQPCRLCFAENRLASNGMVRRSNALGSQRRY
jgi:hypothetical protein